MDTPEFSQPQSPFKNLKFIFSNRLLVILSLLIIFSGIILYFYFIQTPDIKSTTAASSKIPVLPPLAKQLSWEKVNVTIQKGENLSEVFERLNLKQGQLLDIIEQKRAHTELTLLFPQEKMEIFLGPNREIEQLNFPINFKEMLQVTRQGEDYISNIVPLKSEIKFQSISGSIKRSFSIDAIKAKLHPKQVKEFATIFADEVDFKRKVKPGDQFSLVYETYYANNEFLGSGEIVAAEYIDRHKKAYRAIRDKDSLGRYNYYTPGGVNLRNAFERYPLVFQRISSRFSLLRAHPVMNKIVRPHKGVDFAAPTGRPVQASGDGQIIFAGTKTGFGNTIIIRHSRHYKTLYAHLDHFAAGIHPGMHVEEGQLIAYVGETGIATGPHLHYEFSVDGKPQNPLTVAFPRASGIPAANRTEFAAKVKQLTTLLTPAQRTVDDFKS